MVITWKNIGQSDTNAGSAAMRTGGEYLNKGLKRLEEEALGVSARAKDKWDIGSQENTDAMISNIRAISNLDDYNAAVAAGTFGDAAGKAQYGHQVDMGQVRTALEQRDDDIVADQQTSFDRNQNMLTQQGILQAQAEAPLLREFRKLLTSGDVQGSEEFLNANANNFVDTAPMQNEVKVAKLDQLISGAYMRNQNGNPPGDTIKDFEAATSNLNLTSEEMAAATAAVWKGYEASNYVPANAKADVAEEVLINQGKFDDLTKRLSSDYARDLAKIDIPTAGNPSIIYDTDTKLPEFIEKYGKDSEWALWVTGGTPLKQYVTAIEASGLKGPDGKAYKPTATQIKYVLASEMRPNGIFTDAGIIKDKFEHALINEIKLNRSGKAEAAAAALTANYDAQMAEHKLALINSNNASKKAIYAYYKITDNSFRANNR